MSNLSLRHLYTFVLICICNITYSQNIIQLFDNQRSTSKLRSGQSENLIINKQVLHSIKLNQPSNLNFLLPGKRKSSELRRYMLFGKGFFVSDDKGKHYFPQSDIQVFQSTDNNELISLIIFDENVSIFYTDGQDNHTILSKEKDIYQHIIEENFYDENFDCKVIESETSVKNDRHEAHRSGGTSECVDIYFEVDNKAYKNKGSSIPNTTSWVINLVAQVAIQYNRIKIPLKISGIKIFTSIDPYASLNDSTANNMEQTLYEFRDSMSRQGFNGRLAHLLAGRSIGGGIAYLSSLCSSFTNVAVSGNLNSGVTEYPSYSWNVNVIAHELGHNFGSPHTHDCSWNGNNTAIDGCRAPSGCPAPPSPPASVGGTIMSYCHLTSSGINPLNGFGPQPGARIYDRYVNATCQLSADCSGTPPLNDLCYSAIQLSPNIACNVYAGSFDESSPSNGLAISACNTNNELPDVWFTTVIPSGGVTVIETKQIVGGSDDIILEIYKGDCFGLTYFSCDDNSGDENHSRLTLIDSLLYGDTLFIRVIDKNNIGGKFGICVQNDYSNCDSILLRQLTTFYSALDGNNWINKSGWSEGLLNNKCDYCSWFGIGCDEMGNINSLELAGNGLTGILGDSITLPFGLINLNLSNNSISGIIPRDWDSLKSLKFLDLSHNNFQDTLPNFYKDHQKLCQIDLSHNSFFGRLPIYTGYLPSLTYFDLSNNNLSGCFENSLHNLCLKTLHLEGNPLLVYEGNTTFFCENYSGVDNDLDGFCRDFADCDDNNKNVYPNATEICDNLDNDCDMEIDEGVGGTNSIFDAYAVWSDSSKWSLGHPPLPCEKVVIGNGTTMSLVSLNGGYIELNSITINQNATLTVQSQSNLNIVRGPSIVNYGDIHLFGGIGQYSPDSTFGVALENYGNLYIENTGYLNLSTANQYYILNHFGGSIINKNNLSLSLYSKQPTYGIYNMGSITNEKNLSIYGVHNVPYLFSTSGSTFLNKVIGKVNFSYSRGGVGGSNFGAPQQKNETVKKE